MTRKIVSILTVSVAALALAACNNQGADRAYAPAPEAVAVSDAAYAREEAGTAGNAPDAVKGGIMLAYSYSMGVEAPKEAIPVLIRNHEKLCVDAGPAVCQVLGSSINSWGEDQVGGWLNLRAEPSWLEGMRGMIASDADKSGGRLTSNSVSTEDLTTYITDTDARLKAKLALRERIENLLETQEGSLADILAAERALAEVQGEIDSMTAQLEAAKARVAMSALTINYQSDPKTSVGVFKPLSEAFRDFGRTSVQSLASAVSFVARAWPFFIVLMVVLVILRSWWRGRRKA